MIATIISPAYSRGAQNKGAAPPAPAADACSLLTKEDAAAALGGTVSGPKSVGGRSAGPGNTVSSCEYTSGDQRVQLILRQMPADQAAIYKGLCAQKSKDGLTGLGDVTCWYDNRHEELQVLKGTTMFSIELRVKGNPTETIKGVAKKVYDRLR